MSEEEKVETAAEQEKETVEQEPVVEESKAEEPAEEVKTAESDEEKSADEATPAEEEKPAEPNYEEQLAQMNDKYLRLRADFENYRRRMARDFADNREKACQNTVIEFLTVYDYFQMALAHFEKGGDMEAAKQGLTMIVNEFQKAFENLNVKIIDALGKDFDPNLHDAVSREITTEMAEGKVLRQWKTGFMMGDKLLRPATVVVAAAPVQDAPAEKEENADKVEKTEEN